jgi:ribonuclease P/MRP protein subunit POP5
MVRFKNRYLVIHVKWEDGKYDPAVKNKDVYDSIRESIAINFGDWGTGLLMNSLSGNIYLVKYWNPATNIGIIRTLRDEFRLLWGSLTFISHIRGRKCRPKVSYTGGTIRSCQKFIVKQIRSWLFSSRSLMEEARKRVQSLEMLKELEEIIP